MRKYFLFSLSSLLLIACSKSYDNDKKAVNASMCYDVDDTKKSYQTFFKPTNAWVGDAIPFYENGKHYVFYLHDTRPAGATFHPWHLASTTNFLTYENKGEAIGCGDDNSDEDALGTGSVIKHNNTYYAFYTAHNRNLTPNEKIHLATSTNLISWEKQTSFSLQAENGYDANDFRDPFVYKDGNIFRMLITTRAYISSANDWQATIAHYTSTDLISWKLETPFYFNKERFLECPDTFVMGQYEYLIYSNWDWANANRRVLYRYRKVGSQLWITPEIDNLDGDLFYGAKTTFDGNNRYLIGWIPTRNSYKDKGSFSWGGNMAVHQVEQNSDGTLRITFVQTITNLLANSQNLGSLTLTGGQIKIFDRLEKTPAKITTSIAAQNATQFGIRLGACGNLHETYDVLFDLDNSMLKFNKNEKQQTPLTITAVRLPISPNKMYNVTMLIEGSVGTVYVNNQVALSFRCYKMNNNAWGVFSENATAEFSNITISK